MIKTRADIVGKRAHFMKLAGQKDLLYRYPNMANRWAPCSRGDHSVNGTYSIKYRFRTKIAASASNFVLIV